MTIYDILRTLWPVIFWNCFGIITLIIFAFIFRNRERDKTLTSYSHKTFVGPYLREYGYWITSPLIHIFVKLKLTPNILTLVSPVIMVITGYYYYKGIFGTAGWLLLLSGIFDMLDGRLARMTNQITKEGAFLDSNLDRYSDGILFGSIALYFRNNLFMLIVAVLVILGVEITSYAKARGEVNGFVSKIGLMQRAERFVLLWLASVLHPFIMLLLNSYGITTEYPMIIALVLMAILTNYTAIVRIVYIFRDIKKQASN